MKAKKNFAVMSAAVVMATVGLLLAACNMHWICGTFKVAEDVAIAIVNAIEIGSWAAFFGCYRYLWSDRNRSLES